MGRKRVFTDKERKQRARERVRKWKLEHPERSKDNLERARERAKQWQRDNPEIAHERSKRWQQEHPEKHLEADRKWKMRNPEKRRQAAQQWEINHPESVFNRMARRRAKIGNQQITKEGWLAVMKEWRFHCAYCDALLTDKTRTVDHVVPFGLGGRHHKDNLVPACRFCNTSKNNRCPERWPQMPRNSNSWRILNISLCERLRLFDIKECNIDG